MFQSNSEGLDATDRRTGKLILAGTRARSLYTVDLSKHCGFFSNRQKKTTDSICHCRLDHCSSEVVEKLKSTGLIDFTTDVSCLNICNSCQLAKASCLPFVDTVIRAKTPFAKVHCDVWGPAPAVSIDNFRYYIALVDDYTRLTWLYPLYNKSGVFSVFCLFEKLVERQFGARIKCIQTDGGGEFTSHQFRNHLSYNYGILHNISWPHTLAQNGLVERGHRIIVETGLSLLFHSKVPNEFLVTNHDSVRSWGRIGVLHFPTPLLSIGFIVYFKFVELWRKL